jgi:hypothetical protein
MYVTSFADVGHRAQQQRSLPMQKGLPEKSACLSLFFKIIAYRREQRRTILTVN